MFDFIAIDWGLVRTGLSFGSTTTELITPYDKELFTTDLMLVLEAQIKLKKPTTIVIGTNQLQTKQDLNHTLN